VANELGKNLTAEQRNRLDLIASAFRPSYQHLEPRHNSLTLPQEPVLSSVQTAGSGYAATVSRKIRQNTVYSGVIPESGNPAVTMLIELFPDGMIERVSVRQSSGIPAFDQAVWRGIFNASPLPKKTDGTVERRMELRFLMKKTTAP
jgi:TonB family protein